MGQFVLRIRPPAEGIRGSLLFIAASLLFYGSSFLITALVLPGVDRKLAVLVLSLQYPLLYIFFSLKDAAPLSTTSALTITLGYGIVAIGMAGR